jgi:uncharacterized membrane protein
LLPIVLEIILLSLLLACSSAGRSYLNIVYFMCTLLLIFFVALGYYKGKPVSLAKERRRLRQEINDVMKLSKTRMLITILMLVTAVIVIIVKICLIFTSTIPKELSNKSTVFKYQSAGFRYIK